MADQKGSDLKVSEFTQLFLGTTSEGALPTTERRIPTGSSKVSSSATASKKKDVDLSELDAAQASQLLKERHGGKKSGQGSIGGGNLGAKRYRKTGAVREYHKLVEDASMKAAIQQRMKDEEEDESQAFRVSSNQVNKSRKMRDKIDFRLQRKDNEDGPKQVKKGSIYDSDDESRDRVPTRRRRNISKSDTSSSSDDSTKNRRVPTRRKAIRQRREDTDASSSSDSDDSSMALRRRRQRRQRRKDSEDESMSSSSGTSNKNKVRRRRRKESSSESSSSDEELERRRARARAKRVEAMREVKEVTTKERNDTLQRPTFNAPVAKESSKSTVTGTKGRPTTTSSSSSSESTSSSESSSSEDSSSDEDMKFMGNKMIKPTFVPKQRRQNTLQQQKINEDETALEKKLEVEREKRIRKSRALVQEIVAAESLSTNKELSHGGNQNEVNETGGTTIPPPCDNDDLETLNQREIWEVRELLRILRDSEDFINQRKEEAEKERRSKMTDEERRREDIESGKYRRPGEQRFRRNNDGSKQNTFMQRYHHRGAFYMDDDTLAQDKDDVRHRAAEYSRAATGDDTFDKRAMPKVMQVKKFGFAGYSTKYKGLKEEDTTYL